MTALEATSAIEPAAEVMERRSLAHGGSSDDDDHALKAAVRELRGITGAPLIGMRLLAETGLLFEINRRVLHPLGLALALRWDNSSCEGEPDRIGLISTDDPEGFVFNDESFADGEAKIKSFMEKHGSALVNARRVAVGYVVQETVAPAPRAIVDQPAFGANQDRATFCHRGA